MKPRIVFVGESFGEQEAILGRPMVGPTGIELFKLCNEAGIIHLEREHWGCFRDFWNTRDGEYIDMVWESFPEIYRTNVVNQHPAGNKMEVFCGGKKEGIPGYPSAVKGKYLRKEFAHELERLADELDQLNPNLVVPLGGWAIWALLGQSTVNKCRGTTAISTHTIAGFKCLPTYHPAAIFQGPGQYKLRPIIALDLMKANREAEFPEIRRPAREIWIEPTLEDLETFYEDHIRGCPILSVDIETSGTLITCIGFSPRKDLALVIPFLDPRRKSRCYWSNITDEGRARRFVRRVLEDPSILKLFQNGLYDIAFILRSWGFRVMGAEEDTMLMHHALQPESLKGLGFLGSIYTDEGSWKRLREDIETVKRDD